eukprot:TRINITY_DN14107_c0_g2_i1.p1 TRINITY_DN14107_c0_g2~~TRINITY_DN14107_c0_g2_i1.p1  ORF type:complete len:386 (-),score=77.72 TRINITY_DN14107_c0_g2_i1:155-1285(-)
MSNRWRLPWLSLICYNAYSGLAKETPAKTKEIDEELTKGSWMIEIPPRTFKFKKDEVPRPDRFEEVELKDYKIDEHPVTNRQFEYFVKETKYKTDAEALSWGFALNVTLTPEELEKRQNSLVNGSAHWAAVPDVYWKKPDGNPLSMAKDGNLPVVHISWQDAWRYCHWINKRLPSEVEWENAAQAERRKALYPWGKGMKPMGKKKRWMMNIWQKGDGPWTDNNTAEDGFKFLSPVKSFDPSSYGLYDMLGNVWEWTLDRHSFETFKVPGHDINQKEMKVLKGGSFMDSIDGSFNYKVSTAARKGEEVDSAWQNTGFRCAHGKGSETYNQPPMKELTMILKKNGPEKLKEFIKDLNPSHPEVRDHELETIRLNSDEL